MELIDLFIQNKPQGGLLHEYRADSPSKVDDILLDMLSMEYIYDLIYGHLERIQKIQPILECANLDVTPQIILTVVFDDFWNVCKDMHNRLRYRLKRVILNSARKAMQPDMVGVAASLVGTDKIVIALNCNSLQGAQAERYAEECAERIKSFILTDTGISASIGISNFCQDPFVLWRAYEQSFQALSGSFQRGQGQSLRYQRPPEQHSQQTGPFPPSIQETVRHEIILALTQNDYSGCKQAVGRLTKSLVAAQCDATYIKAMVVTLLAEIAQYCLHLGLPGVSQRLTDAIASIFQGSTISDIESKSLVFLSDMLQRRNSALPDGSKSVINLAKGYINQYYDEPLALSELCTMFGYSPAYFSRRFKAHAGTTFSQYLTQVRIQNAKNCLSDFRLSIDEVAAKTGFQSRSYFTSTFKSATGLTPAQFRHQIQQTIHPSAQVSCDD